MVRIIKLKENPWIKYIKKRVKKQNKNFIGIFTGATGSGKSFSAMRMAEDLMEGFNVNYCCFTSKQFMKTVHDLLMRSRDGEDISGTVVLWDEVGVSHNAREWQTISNRGINYVMQSFRKMNIILLMTAPDFELLDKATRKLLHALFETCYIDTRKNKVWLKPLMIQFNQRSGKIYTPYAKIKGRKIKRISIGLPSATLIKRYEAKKDIFMDELYEGVMDKLEEVEGKEKKRKDRIKLTPNQEKITSFIQLKMLKPDMAVEMGVSERMISRYFEAIEKKGLRIKPFKEESRVIYYDIARE